jgi:hypothetical protein
MWQLICETPWLSLPRAAVQVCILDYSRSCNVSKEDIKLADLDATDAKQRLPKQELSSRQPRPET